MSTLVAIGGGSPARLDPAELRSKEAHLMGLLRDLGGVLVAYSGGTDSAYLAWAATQALGANALAVTADSASLPESHKRDAERFAAAHSIRHEYIRTFEFDNPAYVANNPDRCFHCKDELFLRMDQIAAERNGSTLIYGVNKDDLGDYRPGQRAAKIYQVKAPLVEAGLTKAEIRELSRVHELETWDRPASACLSSRIPYGTKVTPDTVKQVEDGEEAIKALGFRQFRLRYHGDLVRIEIDRGELAKALDLEMANRFCAVLKPLGFRYVSLDLEGYRQGSLNEVLDLPR